MENKKDFLIIMLGLAALCFAFTIKKAENKISIAEAVTKGIIKIQISGKGGHEGNCIRLDVTNLKSSSITITFDAGRRLNSRDESEQDLLIVRDQLVGLRPGEKKNIDLSGFCCQLHNSCPDAGSGFDLGKTADENLLKLAQFINGKAIPDDIIQEAVWCVSDGQDPSNISGIENEEGATGTQKKNITDLRKFVCELIGKKEPWYSTPQKRIVTPERIIEPNPVEVYGAIHYEVQSNTIINSELQDENHKLLFSFNGKNTMTPGKWDYNFHLKVEGFQKGKYHVVLKAGATQIMDKEFSI